MSVNMELYRVFLTVGKCRSLSQAARILKISQPAVSQAIRQLENGLGCRLFIRTTKGVDLTGEGSTLMGYIEQAVGLVNTAEAKLASLKDLTSGELRIGASDTLCDYYLLPYLKRFHALYPEIHLQVTNRTSNETLVLLKSGKVDISFVNLPIADPQVSIRPCMAVQDTFVAGEKYAALRGREVSWQELARLPLILLEPASNSRRHLDQTAAQNGVTLKPSIELGAHSLLVKFAAIGLGVACVTKEFAGDLIVQGNLFELSLTPPIPQRGVGLATLQGLPLSFAAARFAELVTGSTDVAVSSSSAEALSAGTK
ncbi:MAG: LysR family transcriptional regulator [Firmicutes bacterium]|nr:LysR family transcriptional regulator [Bacillota bacterium]